jgi:hypothetical protein
MSDLRGVESNNPCAEPLVVRADVDSTDHERPSGVAEVFQCAEHSVGAASSEISAVLKSDPTRAAFSDEADGFKEELRPIAVDPFAFRIGAGDILARRTSDNDVGQISEIGNNSICGEGENVIVEPDRWIVDAVERAPPWYDLASRDGSETRPVHAERPPASGAGK